MATTLTDTTALADAFSTFKKQVLHTFIELASTSDSQIDKTTLNTIAQQLQRTPSYIRKMFEGVKLLITMPDLLKEIQEDNLLDTERLVAIGRHAAFFSDLDPHELESALRTVLDSDRPCPSPHAISKAIRTGNYKKSTYTPPTPKKRSGPHVSFDHKTSTTNISIGSTLDEFLLMKRLIISYADEHDTSLVSAILHLLQGGKRPRTQVLAIDVPEGSVYVEGEGWVTRQEFEERGAYLQERTTRTIESVIRYIMTNELLTA